MVTYVTGDIFRSPAQVITNTVNCVGVMGAGIALEFKKRYPDLFNDYKQRCQKGEVIAGRPYLFENDKVQVLNFPTKRHWKNNSDINDIEDGLKYLAEHHADMGIFFLALPPLGCGLGGLEWASVKTLIDKHLGPLPDLEVLVYEPKVAQTQIPSDTKTSSSGKTNSGIAARPEL